MQAMVLRLIRVQQIMKLQPGRDCKHRTPERERVVAPFDRLSAVLAFRWWVEM
jgi:hypothetical protein